MTLDPGYWRERASKARGDAEQASDPEQRSLWLQLAEACELLAKEIQAHQRLEKPN
jgi:pyrroloquinoline quinone (PQQ) biosynthesis protein C